MPNTSKTWPESQWSCFIGSGGWTKEGVGHKPRTVTFPKCNMYCIYFSIFPHNIATKKQVLGSICWFRETQHHHSLQESGVIQMSFCLLIVPAGIISQYISSIFA